MYSKCSENGKWIAFPRFIDQCSKMADCLNLMMTRCITCDLVFTTAGRYRHHMASLHKNALSCSGRHKLEKNQLLDSWPVVQIFYF